MNGPDAPPDRFPIVGDPCCRKDDIGFAVVGYDGDHIAFCKKIDSEQGCLLGASEFFAQHGAGAVEHEGDVDRRPFVLFVLEPRQGNFQKGGLFLSDPQNACSRLGSQFDLSSLRRQRQRRKWHYSE